MELLVMRLQDMHRVHPDQIKGRCSQCKAEVAIYPSGQRIMQAFPNVRVICQVCREPGKVALLAPGAREEVKQSVKKGES
jgi:hypothetical protein